MLVDAFAQSVQNKSSLMKFIETKQCIFTFYICVLFSENYKRYTEFLKKSFHLIMNSRLVVSILNSLKQCYTGSTNIIWRFTVYIMPWHIANKNRIKFGIKVTLSTMPNFD